MSAPNFLHTAVQIVSQATEADHAQQYDEALRLYQNSLQYFQTALKYEKNERIKQTILNKVEEYVTRAEQLKELVDNKKVPVAISANKGKGKGSEDGSEADPEDQKRQEALSSSILREKPGVKWDDVAGLAVAKEALKETVIMPQHCPHFFTGNRKPFSGILLYGPPGTGKSYLAKAVATEANSTFFSLSAADLMSKWLGEGEKLVKNLFEVARESKPSVIFIDEVDSLVSARSDGGNDAINRIKTQFLIETDGVGNSMDGVLLLGATNLPWSLDEAMLRRLQKRIFIGLPDLAARSKMIQHQIGTTPNEITQENILELAQKTELYSGSVVVRDALMQPVRAVQNATHFKMISGPSPTDPNVIAHDLYTPCSPGDPDAKEVTWTQLEGPKIREPKVTYNDFMKSLRTIRPTVNQKSLARYVEWTEQTGQDGS